MAAEDDRARTVCDGGCHTLKTAASDVLLAAGDVVGPSSPALAPVEVSICPDCCTLLTALKDPAS